LETSLQSGSDSLALTPEGPAAITARQSDNESVDTRCPGGSARWPAIFHCAIPLCTTTRSLVRTDAISIKVIQRTLLSIQAGTMWGLVSAQVFMRRGSLNHIGASMYNSLVAEWLSLHAACVLDAIQSLIPGDLPILLRHNATRRPVGQTA